MMIQRYLFIEWAGRLVVLAIIILGMALPSRAFAAGSWPLQDGQDLVGQVKWHRLSEADTLVAVARRFGVGYEAIVRANPMVDIWLPEAQRELQLPLQFVLPSGPRQGLVLNLAEMRLFYYPRKEPGRVYSYPVGIGREGWQTPVTTTRIISKVSDPRWYPPRSIREEALATGISLPDVVPAGPENPLGSHALRLGLSGYLLHGTNRPAGVGMRVSHGCIRLYPEDIVALFAQVEVGTTLRIIDEPYKLGWLNDQLYLEVHPAAYSSGEMRRHVMPMDLIRLLQEIRQTQKVSVNSVAIQAALDEASGMPVKIGTRLIHQP